MDSKEVVVHRSSVELVVIGLLAALVVLLAFPMLKGVRPDSADQENQTSEVVPDLLMVD